MSHYTWKPVALHLCLLLQQDGFILDSCDNGEDDTTFDGNLDPFVDELTATDEAWLYIARPFENGGQKKMGVLLVFGNEPHETVTAFTVDEKLEATLEKFEDFWSRRKTPLAEAEASWLEEIRGLFAASPAPADMVLNGTTMDEAREETVRLTKSLSSAAAIYDAVCEQRDRLTDAVDHAARTLRGETGLPDQGLAYNTALEILEAALAAAKGGPQ